MGGKLDLYVIQIRDSKSSRKGLGQPRSFDGSVVDAAAVKSSLSELGASGFLPSFVCVVFCVGVLPVFALSSLSAALLLPAGNSSFGCVTYSFPKHHIFDPGPCSFLGSASQKYCIMRLYRPRSILFMFVLSESVLSLNGEWMKGKLGVGAGAERDIYL